MHENDVLFPFMVFQRQNLMSASIAARMLQLLGYQLYLSTRGSYKLGGGSAICTNKSEGPAYCHCSSIEIH